MEEGVRGEKGGTGGARERPQNDRRDAKGSTLDGGTAKATAAALQREVRFLEPLPPEVVYRLFAYIRAKQHFEFSPSYGWG